MRNISSFFSQVAAVAFVLLVASCGKNPASLGGFQAPPHTPVPSPDLRAVRAHLPEHSIGTGGGGWWSGPGPKRAPKGVAGEAFIYLGSSDRPQLDVAYAGRFPSLGAQVTINGQPWWNTSLSYASPEGYDDQATISAPSWAPADTGTYVFAMTLDPQDRYPELDETNNSDTLIVHALTGNLFAFEVELADTVSGTVVRAETVRVGTFVHITVRSWCGGYYPSYRMTLEQNGETLLDQQTSCPSGSNPELDWIAKDPGVHTFTLSLDPDHQTRESSTSDNTVTASLVVIP